MSQVWNVVDGLSIIKTSDLSDKIKHDFKTNCSCVYITILMHHIAQTKLIEKRPV